MMRLGLALVTVVVGVVAVLSSGAGAAERRGEDGDDSNSVAVVRTTDGAMVGYSWEVPGARSFMCQDGTTAAACTTPRQEIVNVLQQMIDPETKFMLRLGGNSADNTCWQGYTNEYCTAWLNDTDIAMYAAFRDAVCDAEKGLPPDCLRISLGLNAVAQDLDMLSASLASMSTSLDDDLFLNVEIGNEPDAYLYVGYEGVKTYQDWLENFEAYAGVIADAGFRYSGPQYANLIYRPTWDHRLPDFFDTHPDLVYYALHNYPLTSCLDPYLLPQNYTAVLTEEATVLPSKNFKRYADQARDNGKELVMSEAGSVSCGGEEGVSDVFAAAIWALEYLGNMVSIQVRSVHFHTGPDPSSWYAAYYLLDDNAGVQIRPQFYAHRMFHDFMSLRTTEDGEDVVVMDGGALVVEPEDKEIPRFVLRGPDDSLRALIMRKQDPGDADTAITLFPQDVAAFTGPVTVRASYLVAGSMADTTGVVYNQTSYDGTTDGLPVFLDEDEESKTFVEFTVEDGASADGIVLDLPYPSAVLVDLIPDASAAST